MNRSNESFEKDIVKDNSVLNSLELKHWSIKSSQLEMPNDYPDGSRGNVSPKRRVSL